MKRRISIRGSLARIGGAARLCFGLALVICYGDLAAAQVAAQTSEPPRRPILRIETGMHTAPIRRIGVDAANRYLVTVSDDRTVRVWELPSGRLLRIIRVPIGAGNEGRLYAVAISPDGSTIATGGWTGYEWEKTDCIYLFDRESGRLIRRLGGLPTVVYHLVYSPDGRYLAATLSQQDGVRVFSTDTYALVGEDHNYGSGSYGADFDRAGHLLTTSLDGFVRLYATGADGSLRLLAKRTVAGGEQPSGVRFSPDGSSVAVGFIDWTKVAVLQASNLAPLYAPDTTGVNNGDLASVAWSADGKTLYAGGAAALGTRFIRAWADGGRGSYRDITGAAANRITHILPLRDGGIVYGTGDPAFGVIDASGKSQVFTTAEIADFRVNGESFLLSPDGSGVGFAYKLFGQSPARFSLNDRRLDTSPAGGVNWRPPETEDSNLRVIDWNNTSTPKLNGTPLKLDEYEFSRSLALAPDRNAFLLGTEYALRCFGPNGKELWPEPVAAPGAAWAVNISADGKIAVAAYADGTIRWYRMKDGIELLAFFPHADRKRWVIWTPSGYYDASAGAEDLIGWHLNNGKDQAADFFPVGQFRSTYYRPDVIERILLTGDEQLAIAQANEVAGRRKQLATVAQQLPPVVDIISPSDGTVVAASELTVRYRLRAPSHEPVTQVKALVDGRPVMIERDLNLAVGSGTMEREIRVSLPENLSSLSIIAENRFSSSVPATVRVTRSAPKGTEIVGGDNQVTPSIKPKLYVLAIGVSNYDNHDLTLHYAAKDATDFAAAFKRQEGGLYRQVEVMVLTDGKATRDEIADGLDWITKQTTSRDVAVVFLSGHGVTDNNQNYYFLPVNADLDKLRKTGVAFSDIRSTVESLHGKTLFFVDTCHSGNVMGTTKGGPPDINGLVNELASADSGAVVFASSTGKQLSEENATWGNGAFTKAVIEGLNGQAATNGKITVSLLEFYIAERVKELTKGRQTPTTTKPQTVPDFPFAIKR